MTGGASSGASRQPEIHVVAPEVWAATVADRWAERLRERPTLRMCLPTGSTPLPLYAEIATRPVAWTTAEVLLLDEWVGLPPGEPGGCDATLRRSLLDRIDLPEGRYRAIDADADDLRAECAAVDAWLDRGLDLAIVGLGTNGHIGMNEPGSDPASRTHVLELADDTRSAARRYFGDRAQPTHGVTVGLADLLRAQEVWVLVTGQHKAGVARECLLGAVRPAYPGSLLRDHPRCRWWLDEPAAARLPGF